MGGVGDFIQDEIIDPIKEVGRDVDDFVNEEIPGGWLTVGAATGAGLLGSGALGGAAAEGAATAGLGTATGVEVLPVLGSEALVTPIAASGAGVVPSAFQGAVGSALGGGAELGSFGNLGTAGFGSALPPASEVAAGLTAGGFAPGTAANLAGLTAAGTGATNLLGGATAFAPISPGAASFGLKQAADALRAGNAIKNLLGQEPQIPNMLGRNQMPQGSVDYSAYLNLLAQRPRRADITTLLG